MTVPARITQDDMNRATKAVAAAKLDRARIVMDLENRKIEIFIGEPANNDDAGEWEDDDV